MKQAYLLTVNYYKINNPNKVYFVNEYHSTKDSANSVIKSLESLGYVILLSSVIRELENYFKVS